MGDGGLYILDDIFRQTYFPGRVIEFFRIITERFIIHQAFGGWSPEQRAEVHLRSPLTDHGNQFGWIFWRGGKARVFEAIDTGYQSPPDLFRSMRMRNNRQFVFVCLIHDRMNFFQCSSR